MASMEMPKYKCHKVVHALKVRAIEPFVPEPGDESDGSSLISWEDERYSPFRVSRAYIEKHKPAPGGYFVVYEDGYESFSPAKAFEDGYTRI